MYHYRYKHTHTPVMDQVLYYGASLTGGGSNTNGGRSVLTSSIASCLQDAGEETRPTGLVSYEPEDHLKRQGQDL